MHHYVDLNFKNCFLSDVWGGYRGGSLLSLPYQRSVLCNADSLRKYCNQKTDIHCEFQAS